MGGRARALSCARLPLGVVHLPTLILHLHPGQAVSRVTQWITL